MTFNDGNAATYVEQKTEVESEEEVLSSLKNDLRAKTIQSSGETLEEQLLRMDK